MDARKQLFEPGRYLSLPDAIARRKDLTSNDKLVWMVLASHLGPDGTEVWPSVNRMAAMAGINRETAIICAARLEAAELVNIERRRGRPNIYRILQPEAGLFEQSRSAKPRRVEAKHEPGNPTSREIRPVGKTDQSGKPTPPVGKSDDRWSENPTRSTVLKYSKKKRRTPLTPRGQKTPAGGRYELSSPQQQKIAEALDLAYRAVFGAPMPRRWHRRLAKLNGSVVVFASVTTADIQTAMTRAKEQKRSFGFGWVENVMLDKAAAGQVQAKAKLAQKCIADKAAKQAQEQQAQQRQAEAKLAHFRSLDEPMRKRFLVAAREKFRFMKRQDMLEQQAAHMAWQERASTEATA